MPATAGSGVRWNWKLGMQLVLAKRLRTVLMLGIVIFLCLGHEQVQVNVVTAVLLVEVVGEGSLRCDPIAHK